MDLEKIYDTLNKFAKSKGWELNKDKEAVMFILEGLIENEKRYGYRACPCRLHWGEKEKDKDVICPCQYSQADIEEFGSCFCSLYVSPQWNEGLIEKKSVPERRPLEKRPLI